MSPTPYQRERDGARLNFKGINCVLPTDKMPPGKYPFAQNVRAYLRDRVIDRNTQDVPVEDLGTGLPVHSLRRLNDTTPNGPASGFILVGGSGVELFANQTVVDSGLSGNPISLIPFRPNASVQPWMYVGDSVRMDKVRSDGTCYLMGIEEPQSTPQVVSTPASNVLSTVGPVTVTYWGDSPHSGPTGNYIWKNASDLSGAGPIRSSTPAAGVTTGNSLIFDLAPGNPANPMQWTQYVLINSVVNTSGTTVTWVSGDQFGSLTAGQPVVIGTTLFVVATGGTTTLVLQTSAGTQTGVSLQATVLGGTSPLFQPALESEGYADFNFCLEATLYVPAAGTYTLSFNSKDEVIWGIGGTASGTASWPKPTGGQVVSLMGQTKTALNGYPLMPKTVTLDGGGQTDSATVSVTFSAAGNYPFEIDFDYWYHSNRTLVVKANGINIPPLVQSVITQSQYRYTYRSSATGATSNPSPASTQQSISVLANYVAPSTSTDPQVDKIDIYRLDQGLTNYTYVGTTNNNGVNTVTESAVTVTGVASKVDLATVGSISPGQQLIIDSGGNQEGVTVLSVYYPRVVALHFFPGGIMAVFTKTHSVGAQVVAGSIVFFDQLLDVDIAANPLLEYDNFQPFPSIDLPRAGVVNVANGVATWVSGDQFNTRWLPGTVIIVGTVAYTLDKRPTDATHLTATNTEIIGGVSTIVPLATGTKVGYEIAEPILAAQPLPYMWGPTDNVSFMFACGDPLRPGTLYWTKGNNPDSAPDTNQQDLTSPSEPLVNGCIVNGIGLVMTPERGFLIYPNFYNALATITGTQGSTWTIQESISTRGLYMPRCIAVDGGGNVFFRAKDGVMMSPGGQGAISITDDDLYNLFPHEGSVPQPVIILATYIIYPPDDTHPQSQRMNVANGYLYYDYTANVNGTQTPQTLVYDIAAKGWVVDNYQFPATLHILEEGPTVNGVLLGCQDGKVRPLTDSGAETAQSVVLMKSENAGDTRALKHWGDIYIEGETL